MTLISSIPARRTRALDDVIRTNRGCRDAMNGIANEITEARICVVIAINAVSAVANATGETFEGDKNLIECFIHQTTRSRRVACVC